MQNILCLMIKNKYILRTIANKLQDLFLKKKLTISNIKICVDDYQNKFLDILVIKAKIIIFLMT